MQVIDIDMNSFNQEGSGLFSKQVLKQKEVPGYDPEQYKCCRLYAPSTEDGVSIPISIVFHKSLLPKGDSSSGLPQNVPLLMNGYGNDNDWIFPMKAMSHLILGYSASRFLRLQQRPIFLVLAGAATRPRNSLRHSSHPRRRGDGESALV